MESGLLSNETDTATRGVTSAGAALQPAEEGLLSGTHTQRDGFTSPLGLSVDVIHRRVST